MADDNVHMVEVGSNNLRMKDINKMDCAVFDYFTKLRNEVESERIQGGIALLKYLIQQNSVSVYLQITSKLIIFARDGKK